MISLLVAASENNVIGKDNKLLWHLPNDMKFFKNLTWGGVVVMGRKTFESMGKPLPGRTNIVISSGDTQYEGTIKAHSIQDALDKAHETNCKEIFIIGGGKIYEQTIGLAQKLYMTRVHTRIEGDTYFPVIDKSVWRLQDTLEMIRDAKHAFDYTFETWVKK